jgi:hypothetical protein
LSLGDAVETMLSFSNSWWWLASVFFLVHLFGETLGANPYLAVAHSQVKVRRRLSCVHSSAERETWQEVRVGGVEICLEISQMESHSTLGSRACLLAGRGQATFLL